MNISFIYRIILCIVSLGKCSVIHLLLSTTVHNCVKYCLLISLVVNSRLMLSKELWSTWGTLSALHSDTCTHTRSTSRWMKDPSCLYVVNASPDSHICVSVMLEHAFSCISYLHQRYCITSDCIFFCNVIPQEAGPCSWLASPQK